MSLIVSVQQIFKKTDVGAEKVPSVKCLPGRHKNLSFISRTHVKKSHMVTHACNPSAEEAEMGVSLWLEG